MQYDKLKLQKSFAQLRKKGSSFVAPAFVLITQEQQSIQKLQLGVTSSKKIGNAVMRNKARRRIKAALSNVLKSNDFSDLNTVQINIICRAKAISIKLEDLEQSLKKNLQNVSKNLKKS